ncbi:hypothetical protein ACSSS7_004615 [Eimeria intestinalis]
MADGECALEGSLQELIQTPSLKWIFVGGKGGVGKTTTSCAIAIKLAEHRESVLLLSTDPAHNLSDALTQKFSSTPSLVNGFTNLYAMEIDARQHEAADFRLAENSDAKAYAQLLPELLQAVPGIDEALSFAELMQYGFDFRSPRPVFSTFFGDGASCAHPSAATTTATRAAATATTAKQQQEQQEQQQQEQQERMHAYTIASVQTMSYSAIIFDTAPTGHTLRLLGFPDLLERGLAKLSAAKNHLSAAVGLLGAVSGNPMQASDFSAKIDSIRAVTTSVREAFQDPARTTFVCVCIPEFLSLFETERLVQELGKHGIDCSNIVVNQVLMPVGIRVVCENGNDDAPLLKTLGAPQGAPLPLDVLLQSAAARKAGETAEEETRRLRQLVQQLQHRLLVVEQNYAARRRMQSKYLQQIQELYSFDFHVGLGVLFVDPSRPAEPCGSMRLPEQNFEGFRRIMNRGGFAPEVLGSGFTTFKGLWYRRRLQLENPFYSDLGKPMTAKSSSPDNQPKEDNKKGGPPEGPSKGPPWRGGPT